MYQKQRMWNFLGILVILLLASAQTYVPYTEGPSFFPSDSPSTGQSIALSEDGSVVAISSPDNSDSTVFVYRRHGNNWISDANFSGTVKFVGLSGDGNLLAFGDTTYTYQPSTTWSVQATLNLDSDNGELISSLSRNGLVLATTDFSPSTTVYRWDGTSWKKDQSFPNTYPSLSSNGNDLLLWDFSGAVTITRYDTTSKKWSALKPVENDGDLQTQVLSEAGTLAGTRDMLTPPIVYRYLSKSDTWIQDENILPPLSGASGIHGLALSPLGTLSAFPEFQEIGQQLVPIVRIQGYNGSAWIEEQRMVIKSQENHGQSIGLYASLAFSHNATVLVVGTTIGFGSPGSVDFYYQGCPIPQAVSGYVTCTNSTRVGEFCNETCADGFLQQFPQDEDSQGAGRLCSVGGLLEARKLQCHAPYAVTLLVANLPLISHPHPQPAPPTIPTPLQWYALPSTPNHADEIQIQIETTGAYNGTLNLYTQFNPLGAAPKHLKYSQSVSVEVAADADGLVTFPIPWEVADLGIYYILVNASATKFQKHAKLEFYLVFHFFPRSGRFVLPLSQIVPGQSTIFYNQHWEQLKGYQLFSARPNTFFGFTHMNASKLACSYTQTLIPPQNPNQVESYWYMGIPLIQSQDQIVTGAAQAQSQITKFAILSQNVKQNLRKKVIRINPGTGTTTVAGTIFGTYCINKTAFNAFE